MTWTRDKSARLREVAGRQFASERDVLFREFRQLAIEACDVLDRAMDAATGAAVAALAGKEDER